MPQMAPLMWMNLMIMFSIILIMTNTMNFFYKNMMTSYNKTSKLNSNNWKW